MWKTNDAASLYLSRLWRKGIFFYLEDLVPKSPQVFNPTPMRINRKILISLVERRFRL